MWIKVDTPTEEVIKRTNWKTLVEKYETRLLILGHRCYYGGASSRLSHTIITKNDNGRLRDSHKLKNLRSEKDFLSKSVSNRVSILWNTISKSVKGERNQVSFKNCLKTCNLAAIDFVTYMNNKEPHHLYLNLLLSKRSPRDE